MNVTELARQLRVNTSELLEILPEFGFDIGKKAIKVDNKVAQKVQKEWPRIRREIERRKEEKEAELAALKRAAAQTEKKEVTIPAVITVRNFAALVDRPVNEIIKLLMKSGVMASLNERIDFDTASIIADDLGVTVTLGEGIEVSKDTGERLKELLKGQEGEQRGERPPVVVIMGHVDHGKTKLLDTIRSTNVIATESGGITQHIGAYQVEKKGKKITFIDTPGHEAFTAMRSRGARIADIAILVVAADDSIQPQTLEAMKIIQQAKLPMIVAINKIDKEDANIEKVKKDLSDHNLIPEEWGGKQITVPISAKNNIGIDDLLDAILLVAEINKDQILANPNTEAVGSVIESHVDKGMGPVATVLIQKGTLKLRDDICVDGAYFGKVRKMEDFMQRELTEAGPSTPVRIIGMKFSPKVGDIVEVVCEVDRKQKKVKAHEIHKEERIQTQSQKEGDEEGVTKLNLIIKADVLGSLEAILESLEKIPQKTVKIQIVGKGLGNITDSEVLLAENTGAMLIGFHVKATPNADELAREKEIPIHRYEIIYDLIDEVKQRHTEMLPAEIVRTNLGQLKVLAIFKTESKSMIVGGKVITGVIRPGTKVEIMRGEKIIETGEITGVKAGKEAMTEVVQGQECGVEYKGFPEIQVGDTLKIFKEEEVKQKA